MSSKIISFILQILLSKSFALHDFYFLFSIRNTFKIDCVIFSIYKYVDLRVSNRKPKKKKVFYYLVNQSMVQNLCQTEIIYKRRAPIKIYYRKTPLKQGQYDQSGFLTRPRKRDNGLFSKDYH